MPYLMLLHRLCSDSNTCHVTFMKFVQVKLIVFTVHKNYDTISYKFIVTSIDEMLRFRSLCEYFFTMTLHVTPQKTFRHFLYNKKHAILVKLIIMLVRRKLIAFHQFTARTIRNKVV